MLRKIQLILLLLFGTCCFCFAAFGAHPDWDEVDWPLAVGDSSWGDIEHPDHSTPKLQFAPAPGRNSLLVKRASRNLEFPVADLTDNTLLLRYPATPSMPPVANSGEIATVDFPQHPVRAGPGYGIRFY